MANETRQELEVGQEAETTAQAAQGEADPADAPYHDTTAASASANSGAALSTSSASAPAPSPEDLARQLSTFALPASPSAHDSHPPPSEPEEEWPLKEIFWPPLPPTPSDTPEGQVQHSFDVAPGLKVRVICQNKNGPCSLIALCNVLILRSQLVIPPTKRSVSYSFLSNLLADYFLSLSPPSSAAPPDSSAATSPALSLDSALAILPQTRYGLTLNPQFTRIDGFANTTHAGELALFALARVPLLHGWLADPSTPEVFSALEACGDYDTAMEWVVAGAEVAGPKGLELDEGALGEEELLQEVERRSKWTADEEEKVRRATLISTFLQRTSTQLTYTGLFTLSSSPLLPPSGLAALFRNSHLSVLYRRPSLPSSAPSTAPELFTLVTDSAFAAEPEVVWESLGDVDGSASEFFDARLRRSSTRGGDFVSSGRRRRADGEREAMTTGEGSDLAAAGADLALAQQLQAEEHSAYERALAAQEDEQRRLFQRREMEEQEQLVRAQQAAPGRAGRTEERDKKAGKKREKVKKDDKCVVM
ncbi:hypothetical protein JCM10207_000266 [Rhodosporidiobolus poonsookiae]